VLNTFCSNKIKYLNLSYTNVDDKSLHIISTSCCGLLQLLMECCKNVIENGVKHVVQNCTQLPEINLRYCDQVKANVVSLMVLSRPSLRKIIGFLLVTERGKSSCNVMDVLFASMYSQTNCYAQVWLNFVIFLFVLRFTSDKKIKNIFLNFQVHLLICF